MIVLRLDLTFDLPEGFQGGALEALEEFLRFARDPEAGLDEAPATCSYSTKPGAVHWNRRLGLRAACRSGVYELTLKGWSRRDPALPARCHLDADGETWLR